MTVVKDYDEFLPRYLLEVIEGEYRDVSTEIAMLYQMIQEAYELLEAPNPVGNAERLKDIKINDWLSRAKDLTS